MRNRDPDRRASKPLDLGALCREHTQLAVKALLAALSGTDTQAAVTAARVLLEHGHGSAVQHLALHVPKIAVECRTPDPDAASPNGADAEPRAWNA